MLVRPSLFRHRPPPQRQESEPNVEEEAKAAAELKLKLVHTAGSEILIILPV